MIGLIQAKTPKGALVAGDPFYKTEAWRRLRQQYRAEHPVCETPLCSKPTSHVDHILSRKKGGASLDKNNLQAQCHSCHSRKTAMIDGGFGNKARQDLGGVVGCDASGNPLDPKHRWNRS